MPEPELFVFTRDGDRLVGVRYLVGIYLRALRSADQLTLMCRRVPELLGPTTIEQAAVG